MLRGFMRSAALMAVAGAVFLAGPASAKIVKLKGLHDDHERVAPLIDLTPAEITAPARIFSVIGGDYGFAILDENGNQIMYFEEATDAIGTVLEPGVYSALPSIDGDLHHHQFIEVLLKQ